MSSLFTFATEAASFISAGIQGYAHAQQSEERNVHKVGINAGLTSHLFQSIGSFIKPIGSYSSALTGKVNTVLTAAGYLKSRFDQGMLKASHAALTAALATAVYFADDEMTDTVRKTAIAAGGVIIHLPQGIKKILNAKNESKEVFRQGIVQVSLGLMSLYTLYTLTANVLPFHKPSAEPRTAPETDPTLDTSTCPASNTSTCPAQQTCSPRETFARPEMPYTPAQTCPDPKILSPLTQETFALVEMYTPAQTCPAQQQTCPPRETFVLPEMPYTPAQTSPAQQQTCPPRETFVLPEMPYTPAQTSPAQQQTCPPRETFVLPKTPYTSAQISPAQQTDSNPEILRTPAEIFTPSTFADNEQTINSDQDTGLYEDEDITEEAVLAAFEQYTY